MTTTKIEIDYKENDDLELYDSVIEVLSIDHKNKSITFTLLKVIGSVDRSHNSFTYKVRRGKLVFENVIYANIPYSLEFNEWSEFYRSAELKTSEELIKFCTPRKIVAENYKHYYLGIDNGDVYKEIDIFCKGHTMELEREEKILHDDFDWLYDE